MSHSFVFDNKDDPILHSIAQELHTSLNQQPTTTTTTTNELDPSNTTTVSASLHAYEFRLESFLTRPRTCTTLFPPRVQKSRYSQILVQERLVLLSAGPSSSLSSLADSDGTDTDKEDEKKKETATQVLVAGLEVLEYTLTPLSPPSPSPSGNKTLQAREERIIYIAKVDTSGFWPLPGLESASLRGKSPAQALVKGYLRSVRATSHGLSPSTDITVTGTKGNSSSSSDTTSSTAAAAAGKMSALSITSTPTTAHLRRPRKTSLYIFARAQPQYLFANSAKNPQKRVLDDRGLVRWWKNTAASVYAESMDPSTTTTQEQEQEAEGKRSGNRKTKVQGWWHIPGIETERQAHNVIQSTTATNNSKAFEWIYGYPDKDSKELANALIPQFPDDPKSRMMQSPSCQGGFVNIRTFWELAAIGEESGAGKITGFFRVVEEDEDEDEGEEEEGEEMREKAVTGTTTGYTKVINFLLDLEFSTMEDARMSTRTWQDRVEVWVRKSVEKEAERVLEVEATRQQEQKKEDGKEEEEVKEEKKKEAVVTVRPLWIQKGSVEVLLCHGSDIPPTPSPAVATQESTTTTVVHTSAATPAVVNTLSMGLIKRKAPTPASTTSTTATTTIPASTTATPSVNVLGAGLIKRKVVAPTPVTTSNNTPAPAAAAPVVNVLGAGLIKRKVAPTSTTPTTTITTMLETSSTAPVVNVLGASFIKKRKTDS